MTVASASLVIASARSKKTAQLNMKPGVKVGQPLLCDKGHAKASEPTSRTKAISRNGGAMRRR